MLVYNNIIIDLSIKQYDVLIFHLYYDLLRTITVNITQHFATLPLGDAGRTMCPCSTAEDEILRFQLISNSKFLL